MDSTGWRAALNERILLYGHRNWVVVAGSAYPAHACAGIETIVAPAGQLEVVEAALSSMSAARHVKPAVYTDRELAFVDERDAPGITRYREELAALLAGRTVRPIPHEEILAKLDEAGRKFRVLLIKTNLAMPYASVFLELECGFWSAEAESRLRAAMTANR